MNTRIYEASDKDFILQNVNIKTIGKAAGYVILVKANWCPHCIMFMPSFERQSLIDNKYKFVVLEQMKNEDMLNNWKELRAPNFEINGFPTVLLFDNKGKFVKQISDREHIEDELK